MRIILARPACKSGLSAMPIGLGYLASSLKSAGHEAEIVDGALRSLETQTILEKCRGTRVVGVTAMTHFARESFELCHALKSAGHTVLLGGIHPTISPEKSLTESSADHVVTGEAEITLPRLLDDLARGETASPRIIESPRITDLDSLPFPDWEQLDPRDYSGLYDSGQRDASPQAMLLSSRGCCCLSRNCHTYGMWKEQVYFRSPANILKEVDYLRERFRIRNFYFADENISVNRDYLREISLLMKERELSWTIGDHVRPETMDEETAGCLKAGGCLGLTIGSYSEDPEDPDPKRRQVEYSTCLKAARAIEKAGLPGSIGLTIKMGRDRESQIGMALEFIGKLPSGSALHLTLIPSFEAGQREFEEFRNTIIRKIPAHVNPRIAVLYESGNALPDYEKKKGMTIPAWGLKYLLEGRIFFSRPVRLIPTAGKKLIPGSAVYTVEGLELTVKLGKKEVPVIPEIYEDGRLRALIPLTGELMPPVSSASARFSLPRHLEVFLPDLPVDGLRISLPDVRMHPCSG